MRWGEPNECTCIRNKRMIVERGEGGEAYASIGSAYLRKLSAGATRLRPRACSNCVKTSSWKRENSRPCTLSLSLYLLSLPLIISFPFRGSGAITRNDERLRKRWKARFDALSCYVTQQVLPIAVNYGGVVSLSSCCSIDRFDAVLYPLYAAFTLVYLFI